VTATRSNSTAGASPPDTAKLPGIAGIREFKGKLFHTARREYGYTGGSWKNPVLDELADKRVAIIGTGASAVQAIPHLGRYARQLYVLQRTPSSVDKRPNPPTDPEWMKTLQPGWKKQRQAHFHRVAVERLARGEPDLICDIWTEINRNLAAKLEAQGWPELTIPSKSRAIWIGAGGLMSLRDAMESPSTTIGPMVT
jgi:cation diffusion facilitator CzcD-associated flavoprotein CzcO